MYWAYMSRIFCILLGLFLAVSAEAGITGWWFDPQRPGTGLAVEDAGEKMFVAIYSYHPVDGIPIWMSSALYPSVNDPEVSEGDLMAWYDKANSGGGLNWFSSYPQDVVSADVGDISLSITAEGNLKCTVLERSPDEQQVVLERFMDYIAPGISDTRVTGWWYDPAHTGTGFFLEAQGGTLFGAWYTYGEQRKTSDGMSMHYSVPVWLTFTGPFSIEDTHGDFPISMWENGSAFSHTESYAAPIREIIKQQLISIDILDDNHINLSFHGFHSLNFNLERFSF